MPHAQRGLLLPERLALLADKRFSEQIEALSALITNDDEAEIYADVIGPDADERFAALDLSRQRRS